jgi:hypothetical protein
MSDNDKSVDPNADRVAKIRERAYAIWLDQGQVHDRDEEHWLEAEREIDREGAPAVVSESAGEKSSSAFPKSKVASEKDVTSKAAAPAKPKAAVKSAPRAAKESNGLGTRA